MWTGLTPREQAVLHGVALGYSNKQIGHALAVSSDTVKYHLKNVYTKLGARGRIQAVGLAGARGLLDMSRPFGPQIASSCSSAASLPGRKAGLFWNAGLNRAVPRPGRSDG